MLPFPAGAMLEEAVPMDGSLAYLVVVVGCLIAVAGLVVAALALRKARRDVARAATKPRPADPFRSVDDDADAVRGDPRRLRPGDIVEIGGSSYGVRGSLHFNEGDYSWAEHLLDGDQGVKRWISVEEDPDLELVLWTAVPGTTVTPGSATLDFEGRQYASDESGRARFVATGTTGLNPTGSMRYHDYVVAGDADARLSFESYGDGGPWEAAHGKPLHRAEIMIYPRAAPAEES